MEIKIKTAEFVTSVADFGAYMNSGTASEKPQLCVVGRSNVGKSSFINMLSLKKIAKTSSTPGRTRLINLFSFKFTNENFEQDEFLLVDLPGYGYAMASKDEKNRWGAMIEKYLTESKTLNHVFSLIDARHEPTKLDKQMIEFLFYHKLPFTVIATKIDKLSRNELARSIQRIASSLGLGRDDIIAVSALKVQNRELIEQRISQILESI